MNKKLAFVFGLFVMFFTGFVSVDRASAASAPKVSVIISRCLSVDAAGSSTSIFLLGSEKGLANSNGELTIGSGPFVIAGQNRIWVNASFKSVTGEIVSQRIAFNEGTTGISSMVSNCNTSSDAGKLGIDIEIN